MLPSLKLTASLVPENLRGWEDDSFPFLGLRRLFTDCNMANHHEIPPFGRIFWSNIVLLFPGIVAKQIQDKHTRWAPFQL